MVAVMCVYPILTQAATTQTSEASLKIKPGTLSLEFPGGTLNMDFTTTFSSNKQTLEKGYPLITTNAHHNFPLNVKDFRGANSRWKLLLKYGLNKAFRKGIELIFKDLEMDIKDKNPKTLKGTNIKLTNNAQEIIRHNNGGHFTGRWKSMLEIPPMTDVRKQKATIVWELTTPVS